MEPKSLADWEETSMKKTLAVFFGGRSVEHDISIVTGLQLIENMDREKYDCIPVYISRDGQWYTGAPLAKLDFLRHFDPENKEVFPVFIAPVPGERALQSYSKSLLGAKVTLFPFDVAILCMHGVNGEDGALQGVMEMADVPYSSSGLLGSAAGMDKILMKAAFAGAKIPVVKDHSFLREEWEANPDSVIAQMESKLEYPVFVKPANLGSSIGIGCAEDRDGFYAAAEVALRYDARILVENAVKDAIEINCSVMGYAENIRPSVCEQPISWQKFLSFEEKYLHDAGNKFGSKSSGDNNGSMQSMSRIVPAQIPDETRDEIQEIACRIFRLMNCKGIVRVDFLVDKEDDYRVYANEINTIPGSMAYYLWEEDGIDYPHLIDHMVGLAMDAHREKSRNSYAYDSDVLKKNNFNGVKAVKSGQRRPNKIQ